TKQAALVGRGKPIQQQGVIAHHQVRVQGDLVPVRVERINGGHRGFYFIAHSSHVQQQLRRLFGQQAPAQAADHVFSSTPALRMRAAVRLWWAWHKATAAASAASACRCLLIPSKTPTMCCICLLSARPRPTMAFLICVGVYSLTGSDAAAPAQIAAPRAWPSFSALAALRETKTSSTAMTSGSCSRIMSLKF